MRLSQVTASPLLALQGPWQAAWRNEVSGWKPQGASGLEHTERARSSPRGAATHNRRVCRPGARPFDLSRVAKKLKFSKRSPGIWMLAPYFTKARSTPTAQPATHAEPTPSASFLPCTGSAQSAPCQGFALRCWSSVWKCSRLGSNCLLSVVNLRCWRMVTELGTRLLPCLLLQFTQLSADCTSELSHILSVGISVLLAKVLPRLCIAPGCILSPFYLVHFFSLPITQSASWDKSKVLVITSLFPSSPKPDLSAS